MRTSEEIYHRVRWDPRFDPARFVMGINVRGAEPKRIPLAAFVPGGDIPWHRVLFLEADGEVVWDRSSGVDRIDTASVGRVQAPRQLRAPFFNPSTPHAWDPVGGWIPATGTGRSPAPGTLRVLTWNTLWDRFDSDRIDTRRRWPLLLAALAEADADVIALQEVERPLLGLLLATDWVRDRYVLGTDPTGRDVDQAGVLLLSRLPVREAGRHVLGAYKAAAAITVECTEGLVVVVVVHLTSDHTPGGAARRDIELARLAEGLSGVDAQVVLVGDVNDGGDTAPRALKLLDAWSEVHGPDDGTVTFDPTRNPLAAVSSLTGRASRLDRVLLRSGPLRPATATLIGDSAVDGLYPSDHFGVIVDLAVTVTAADALDLPPTARTALAWIPPEELWPAVQEVRHKYDPQIGRWPPHVNVLFGFVPESAFEAAVPGLSSAAAEIAPFPIRLSGIRSFTHRDDSTIWWDPAADGAAQWAALRTALETRFPRCRGRSDGYTPHLTLGRTRGLADVRLDEASTVVDELVLLSRRGDEPMRPRAVVSLGTGTVRWLPDEPRAEPSTVDVEPAFERVTSALSDGTVHLVGSRRLGCALPGADLDLVVALPGSVDIDDVRARVARFSAVRPVVGARVPGLRLRTGDLDVDLVVVGTGDIPPAEAVARRAELGEAAAVALSAVSDAEALAETNNPDLARAVKAWARARGLDSAPFGGVPGLGWTVLAARTANETGDAPLGEMLRHFFGSWAAWDWRQPVGDGHPSDRAMTIMTPTAPVRSCTEQVSAGLRDLIVEELYQAWEGRPATPPHRRHAAWAVLTVRPVPGEDFDATIGRFRGRLRALLALLEEGGAVGIHVWPRPFESSTDLRRYAIGLGRAPYDTVRLNGLASDWLRGMAGVSLERWDGGAVPSL